MSHWRLHLSRKKDFKVSHLRFAFKTKSQYLTTVKLPGSSRLAAGNRHLYRYCIFTERVFETALQSLRHSCASELHVLYIAYLWLISEANPTITSGTDYIFISTLWEFPLLYIFFSFSIYISRNILMYIAFFIESRHVINCITNLSRSPLYIGDLSRYGVNLTYFND